MKLLSVVTPNAIYHDSKLEAGNDLKLLYQEFGVPKNLTFDGSKEESCIGTTFMKDIHRQGIYYHIREPKFNK